MLRVLIFLLTFSCAAEAAYQKPAHISQKTWSEVEPYFLPEDHPTKPILDAIFSKRRAVFSLKSMKSAGFDAHEPQKFTRMVVASHPLLPGYLIKTYLDIQKAYKNKPAEYFWMERIKGASAVRGFIDEKGWQTTFAVPQKWIYPLPEEPAPHEVYQRINFILIVEDMNILDDKANATMWKSEVVTKETLLQLKEILEAIGLHDCAKPDNIPFTHNGRIAFIDTQAHHEWPIAYKKMDGALSATMKPYWKKITKKTK